MWLRNSLTLFRMKKSYHGAQMPFLGWSQGQPQAAQVSLLEGELLRDVSIGKNFDATAIQDHQALHWDTRRFQYASALLASPVEVVSKLIIFAWYPHDSWIFMIYIYTIIYIYYIYISMIFKLHQEFASWIANMLSGAAGSLWEAGPRRLGPEEDWRRQGTSGSAVIGSGFTDSIDLLIDLHR